MKIILILVDVVSSIPNGLNHEANDAISLAGTTKGGAAGVSGQSTLSRKSGKKNKINILVIYPYIFLLSNISKEY